MQAAKAAANPALVLRSIIHAARPASIMRLPTPKWLLR
jgi:hypothetical protein